MTPLLTILDSLPAPLWPTTIVGWLGWLVFAGICVWLFRYFKHYQAPWNNRNRYTFLGLLILVPFTTLFFGIRFSSGAGLSLPGIPAELNGPALMLLSALPWVFAGGFLGPLGAGILAFVVGILRFLWDTHSVFTPLEYTLLAILFSAMTRQRYRTFIFIAARQPIVAAFLLSILFSLVFVIDAVLASSGSLAARLDFAITRLPAIGIALGIEFLIAGAFAQVLAIAFPNTWGLRSSLQPSPAEQSLEARFLFGTGLLLVVLLIILLIGDWVVAGNASRQLLEDRLRANAQNASESVPFILETGQTLAAQMASDPALLDENTSALSDLLGAKMRVTPYFDQIILLDQNKNVIASYPRGAEADDILFPEESTGTDLAFNGVLSQMYTIPPRESGKPARLTFVVGMLNSALQPQRVLVARADFDTNPLAQPLISSLKSVAELDGTGMLLDENGRIVYHLMPTMVMTQYSGERHESPSFYDDTAPDGTRSLVYYQPVESNGWGVVLSIPAQKAQQAALTVAAPLSFMILLMGLAALFSLRFGLRGVTNSLQHLANEAMHIAQGQLDRPLQMNSVDEIGQLRRSFEQMRVSLQARLEELNRLLLVSQGVASSLEMADAVHPVLEATLATGASAVRVVLAAAPEEEMPTRFALGPLREAYAHLDEQVLRLTQQQEILVLSHMSRGQLLKLDPNLPAPASILAVGLRHENQFYGVLWAAYDTLHIFSDADVRFISTLAGQAALAAANNYLYLSAQVGRQRLASILASTPDPVLVTDQQDRLLLANPAARAALGLDVNAQQGQPIENVIQQKSLLDVLLNDSADKQSAEVALSNGQIYFATASPVVADGRLVGRVCILRDVTHFKELDRVKSEFVSTVSHDLRSPLTMIRGYATMLETVGDLNEQQKNYSGKIVVGVENMTRLVNNLLDLGRIEAGIGLMLDTVPLMDIFERVTSPLQMLAAHKQIRLTAEPSLPLGVMIEADQALLQQAMYNLVENAIKYTPAGGSVTARIRLLDPQTMRFEVQDTGIGIAPEDKARLFEKFFRGSQREARAEKGSGLGLAIVRSIIERHGGKIWFDSEAAGKGTTFFVDIPLAQPKE